LLLVPILLLEILAGFVENAPARHTHDTSFVQIASGSRLVCRFEYALRIRAYDIGFGRLVCTFGKALRMQECPIVLGSCSFRESREESGSTVRPAWKSWKLGGGKVFVFLLVSRGCSRGRERLTWNSVTPDGYDVPAIDMYSYDRPQLVS